MIVKLTNIILFLLFSASVAAADGTRITADAAYERIRGGKLTLIDVRSAEEWRQTGVPMGARTISLHGPGGSTAFADAVLRAVNGDRTKPIAVICAVGNRSRWAQYFLTKQGHLHVYDVSEGMFGRGKHLPGWIRRGLPTLPCVRCQTASP